MSALSALGSLRTAQKAVIASGCALFTLLLLFRFAVQDRSYSVPSWSNGQYSNKPTSRSEAVHNETLGFQKVFALNLPERTDKRDAMALASSLTNFSIDFMRGIKGQEVVNKSLPYGQENRKFTEPMLGSWRAHLNTIRTVVEQRLSSALIMEDDTDWDIRIKDQLSAFAEAARLRQGYSLENATHSPYGDDWDVLWVGHCHDVPEEPEKGLPIIYHDATTVSLKKLKLNQPQKDWLSNYSDHTRVVQWADAPICSFAYAVSYRGAQKLLWELSVKHLTGLFDNALARWCRDRPNDGKCIGVYPTLFWPHEARGGKGKNSDNNPNRPGIEQSKTLNIQQSAMMNIDKLLEGRTDFEDAYPDEPVQQAEVAKQKRKPRPLKA